MTANGRGHRIEITKPPNIKMTIDYTDYEPRPADDVVAFINMPEHHQGYVKLGRGDICQAIRLVFRRRFDHCDQLGIDFNKLPHCI